MGTLADKRDNKRIKTDNLFIEFITKGTDTVYRVEVINISPGGICFIRNSLLNKGDVIHIKFPFKSRKIVLSASILRIDGREAAAKFLETQSRIEQFIETLNKDYPMTKKSIKDDSILLP